MSIQDQRSNYKTIIREELTAAASRGSVEAIIGLDDINYGQSMIDSSRITNLEDNETIFQIFSYVGTSSSGQVPIYEGGEIFDIYGDGIIDAIAVKADGNQNPIEENVLDSINDIVTVLSLIDNGDGTADYILSNTPVQNACVVYFLKIKDIDKNNVPVNKVLPPVIKISGEQLVDSVIYNQVFS